jgi:Fe-S-cluster containining protein
MECRVGCAACCIAPSISSPIPGMNAGKPAGVRCFQLTADNRCRLFGRVDRPPVCLSLRASEEMCGSSAVEALERLTGWEELTRPEPVPIQRCLD